MSTLLPSLFVAESPSSLTHGALAAASTPRHRPRIIPLARLASGLITVEPAVVRDHVLREDDNRCILITLHGMLVFKKPLGAFAAYTGVKPSSTLAKLISFRPNSVYSTSQCRESINDAESDPKISDFIAILPGLSQERASMSIVAAYSSGRPTLERAHTKLIKKVLCAVFFDPGARGDYTIENLISLSILPRPPTMPTTLDDFFIRLQPPPSSMEFVGGDFRRSLRYSELPRAQLRCVKFKPCMRGGGTKHRTTLKLRVSMRHASSTARLRLRSYRSTSACESFQPVLVRTQTPMPHHTPIRRLAILANALRGHYKILARTSQHSTTQRAAPTALSPPDENAHDPAHPVAHMPAVEHTRMGVHESHRGDEALGRLPFPSAIARSLPVWYGRAAVASHG
ncbi:hypothetical protein B0H11DRAFT_2250285 [Mycena galericulata]|nr:hypothetical protein B0H11DRAFT_2250285 [Mycena galericulata]